MIDHVIRFDLIRFDYWRHKSGWKYRTIALSAHGISSVMYICGKYSKSSE